jgi:nicotinate-nucleotide--dimethylbenzimidazole phosphoribosyltransferase
MMRCKSGLQELKLEAIEEAPVGLVICYDRSVLNNFTIGTVRTIKFSAVCAAQNIWLSLTEQGFSMGWISILNYYQFKKLLGLPEHIEPLGYFV